MTPYLITALALLLVLSPVAWMIPTPRQRREAWLRERARELGIEVRIGELPQTHRQRVRKQSTEQGVIYRLPLRKGWPHVQAHQIRRAAASEAWEAGDDSPSLAPPLARALQQVAERVPADVVAIELALTGPAIYWRERGGEGVVELLRALLGELAEAQLAGVNGTVPSARNE